MIIGIVAVDKQGAIGKGGKLPWHYSADMKFFRETTMGNACVMGSRTWKSLKQPLKKRLNIVLSRQGDTGLLDSGITTSDIENGRLNRGVVLRNAGTNPLDTGAGLRNADTTASDSDSVMRNADSGLITRKSVLSDMDTSLSNSVVVLRSVESVLQLNRYLNCDLFVIGGEKVYESFLPHIEKWIVTEVPLVIEDADAFIPRDYLQGFVKARSLKLDQDLVVSFYDRAVDPG